MQPHSLSTVSIGQFKTPAQKKVEQGWAGRHGYHWPKGTVLPETQVLACPRVKVADLPEGFLKQKWFDRLEQDQKIKSCCRHPENHYVEAWKSHPDELAPDRYLFVCDKCQAEHKFFCVGTTDERPEWKA
jgi:hypothetical protein